MILRNLQVQGFGCFADEIEVGPFSDGINLLYAPNGTGKSTLVRAFTSALVDGYRVKCAELRDWTPWGRELTPRIVVEFDHRGKAYRLEKKFLQGAASVLSRKEGVAWKQFMQNDDADEFVRNDILNCTRPGNGLAKQKNWGLAQILWTTQGNLQMPELAGNVVESIQQSVGATLTAAGSKIESKLASLYAEFYQPKRPGLRNSAPFNGFQKEYDRLSDERASAQQELAEFDRKSAEIDQLRTQLITAQAARAGLQEHQKTTAERVEEYRTLQGERKQQSERKTARHAVYVKQKQETEAIAATRKKIEETGTSIREGETMLPGREAVVDARTTACYRAKGEVESASKDRQLANAKLLTAQLGREYTQTVAQLETLSAAIDKTERIAAQITELQARKTAVKAPTLQELAQARTLAAAEQQYALKLEMARVTAQIEPSVNTTVRVIEGETAGDIALRPGIAATIPGSPNVAFEIPGFGSIRVRGPATDYASVCGQLEKCRTALCVFEERFGTKDTERLESIRTGYTALEQQIATLQAQRMGILGKDDVNKLEARRAQASRRIAEIERTNAEWQAIRPDPETLETAARHALNIAEGRLSNAEARCQELSTGLLAAEKLLTTTRTELTGYRKTLANLQFDLQASISDGKLDTERNAALADALIDYDAAAAALDRIDQDLHEFGNDPSPRLDQIQKELVRSDERLRQLENSILQAETEMAWLTSKSPYERFAKLDEELTVASTVVARERRRMEAIKLLNDVVVETKAELLSMVAGPVERAANENLAAICTQSFGEIRMSSAFGTVGVRPPALDTESDGVAITQLSGGEQEQLHLCTRLALASELAKHERQLLVLDDVLTFTDNDRLARICDLLEKAAGKLQILILTCHPERFISIGRARPFDLEAMAKSHFGAGS